MEHLKNKDGITGSSEFWSLVYTAATPTTRKTKARLQNFQLKAVRARVGSGPEHKFSYVFAQNNNLQKLTRKCGFSSLVVIQKIDGSCELGVCLKVDLYSILYLRWDGEAFYVQGLLSPEGTWNSIKAGFSVQHECFRAGTKSSCPCVVTSGSKLFFVNLVSKPFGISAVIDPATVGADGGIASPISGPDYVQSCKLPGGVALKQLMGDHSHHLSPFPPIPSQRSERRPPRTMFGNVIMSFADAELLRGGINVGSVRSTKARMWTVPFCECAPAGYVRMAYVSKQGLQELRSAPPMSKSEYDIMLLAVSKKTKLMVLGEGRPGFSKSPLYLVSAPPTEPTPSKSSPLNGRIVASYPAGDGNKSHLVFKDAKIDDIRKEINCHALAVWHSLPAAYQTTSVELYDAYNDCFGTGGSYPSRHCMLKEGHQTYLGSCCSDRPLSTPLKPRENVYDSQYYRQSSKHQFAQVLLHKHTAMLTEHIRSAGARLFWEHQKFINGVCEAPTSSISSVSRPVLATAKLVTMGKLSSVLAYACTSHLDGDTFNASYDLCYRQELAKQRSHLQRKEPPVVEISEDGADSDATMSLETLHYLESWVERFHGFDLNTTIGFSQVGILPPSVELLQYFVYDGMGIAVRYGPGSMSIFFGAQMAHNSAVSIAIIDDKVVFHHPSFCTFAWGLAKPDKRRQTTPASEKRKRN